MNQATITQKETEIEEMKAREGKVVSICKDFWRLFQSLFSEKSELPEDLVAAQDDIRKKLEEFTNILRELNEKMKQIAAKMHIETGLMDMPSLIRELDSFLQDD